MMGLVRYANITRSLRSRIAAGSGEEFGGDALQEGFQGRHTGTDQTDVGLDDAGFLC